VIIGTVLSLERQAALSVTERANRLFLSYGGGQCHRYLVCVGIIPQQQINPFVPWLRQHIGTTLYFVGSEYGWARHMGEALKAAFESQGGTVLGMEFFPFSSGEFGPTLTRIRDAQPDMVWHNLVGGDAISFVRQYRSFEMTPQLVAPHFEELWAKVIGKKEMAGCIASGCYFMQIDTPENHRFVDSYLDRFGPEFDLTNAYIELIYDAVWLYAKAVEKADSPDDEKVLQAISQFDFHAPQGPIRVLARNQHLRVSIKVAQAQADGCFQVIETFPPTDPIVPGCHLV
jgi:urea transport system substrate-binding protein